MYTLACLLPLREPPTVTQSPVLSTDAWHRARARTCRFCVSSPPLSLPSAAPHNPNSVRVTEEFCSRWRSGPSGHRAIFSRGFHKHTRPRKNIPLIVGGLGGTMETGTDHKTQFLGIPVPGITRGASQSPEEQRRQRCWRPGAMRFFRGPSD